MKIRKGFVSNSSSSNFVIGDPESEKPVKDNILPIEEQQQYLTRIYPETHCDMCCDIVHNHFECPICGDKYAPTDIFDYMGDLKDKNDLVTFCCEDCGSVFTTDYKIVNHGFKYRITLIKRRSDKK